jgi:nucleoid DNA-binding protein
MGKVTLQNLISSLTEKNGLEPSKAEAFVKTMFDTIGDSLAKDGSVKVKGFGTFKVVDVESRESVNVNTGERVVIEGHRKINFTPEPSVKEIVNKPFSQFETVVLNDGVNFSDIDKTESSLLDQLNENIFSENNEENVVVNHSTVESSKKQNSIVESEDDEPIQILSGIQDDNIEEKDLSDDLDGNITNADYCSNDVDDIADDDVEEKNMEDQPLSNSEPLSKEQILSKEQPLLEKARREENILEKETEQVDEKETLEGSLDEKKDKDKSDKICLDIENEEDESEDEERPRKWPMITGLFILSVVVISTSFYAGFYFGQQNGKISLIEMLTGSKQHATPVGRINAMQASSKRSHHTVKKLQSGVIGNNVKNHSQEKKFSINKTKKTEEANIGFDSEKYDQRNRMVKYGAYKIIGMEKVVTLKSGENLNLLALKNFGSKDMLCYILAMNDMSKDVIVKEGQKIMIPKLELRHKKRK